MWRIWFVLALVPISCGVDRVVDVGWGLSCPGGRYAPMGITPAEPGWETPEKALQRLIDPDRPGGRSARLPGVSLPKDGWEQADFVPTADGTAPSPTGGVSSSTQRAFVHRDDERIDAVVTLQYANGWVVETVHSCAD
jgi:hypothetical protein